MKAFTGIGLIAVASILASDAAWSQLTSKPSFDIADVHVSPRGDWVKNSTHPMQGGYLSGDRYELRRATMLDLIRTAYNIEPDKIYGGPSWLDYDRYEVAAKASPRTSPETLRLMLQALLADRFGLVVKPATQPVPAYILSKGKGELKLKPSASSSADVGCRSTVRFSPGSSEAPERNILCHDASMESLSVTLSRIIVSAGARLPVVDSTGLTGTWDIDIKYAEQPASGGASGRPAIFEELSKLGLSLELGKTPQPVLTVEKVNEKPLPNPPGVEAALPARPLPEFEVASVRLANGGSGGSRALLFQPGGRVTASGMPPGVLITQAWNWPSYEQIVGLPKSFTGTSTAKNVSIVAKAPEGWFPAAPDIANSQAREMLYRMLQSLLIDRYQMKFHWEERPIDAITLTSNKPKLTKADPANRTGCTREGQQQQGRALMLKLVCRNITMEQFVEQMPSFDPGIRYAAQDGTSLEGAWDFTLDYDAMARILPLPFLAAPAAANTAEAADPSGSISFLDAVQKQLGLKVETHKRLEKVLVIDHMLEDPKEN